MSGLPSTALPGPSPLLSCEDAVAVLPSARSVPGEAVPEHRQAPHRHAPSRHPLIALDPQVARVLLGEVLGLSGPVGGRVDVDRQVAGRVWRVADQAEHALGDRDGGQPDLGVEAEFTAAVYPGEVLGGVDPAVRSTAGGAVGGGVGVIQDPRVGLGHGLAQPGVDRGGRVALVGAAPHHDARVDAVPQHRVPGLGEEDAGVLLVGKEPVALPELGPDQDPVLVAAAVKLLARAAAAPVADHGEVHVAVQAHDVAHAIGKHAAEQFVPAPVAAAAEDGHAVDLDPQRPGVADLLDVRPGGAVVDDLDDVVQRVGLLPHDHDLVEGGDRAEVHLDPLVVLVRGGPAGVRIAVDRVAGPVAAVVHRRRRRRLVQGQVRAGRGGVEHRQRPHRVAPLGRPLPALYPQVASIWRGKFSVCGAPVGRAVDADRGKLVVDLAQAEVPGPAVAFGAATLAVMTSSYR